MAPSFHSKIAQHIVKLELDELSNRNPSLGVHPDTQKHITWEMLIDSDSGSKATKASAFAQKPEKDSAPPFFPEDLHSRIPSRHSDSDKSPGMFPPENGTTLDPVAIIGAGAAGLRVAMMLKHLGIPYVVLEASERYGGRCYTYHFKKEEGEDPSTQTYFDVGAMRFPNNAANARTFELFEELEITKEGGRGGKLLPYHLSTDDNVLLFNDRKKTVAEVEEHPLEDHFHDGIANGGLIPEEYIKKTYLKPNKVTLYGVDACLGATFEPYKFLLARDYKFGWELLMQHDSRSTRAHLLDIMRYPADVVQWMETRDSGTNAYDDAFTDSVIDSLEFDYPTGYSESGDPQPGKIEWWCIKGGTEVLTKAMYSSLRDAPPVYTSHQVTSISKAVGLDGKTYMEVTIPGHASLLPTKYSHVVSTVSLSCLRTINLAGCALDYNQKTALRSLKYGTGVKVGIKFKTRWWQGKSFKKQGGSSKTDRQSRVVVYPNYGVEEDAGNRGVLIATYTWNQDAFRLGSLIDPKDWGRNHEFGSTSLDPDRQRSPSEEFLLNQIYEDLTEIHGQSPGWYREQTIDYYAYDWYHNRYTMGGYALFGPGQFNNLYLEITKPAADGYLHFGGEAASAHHAWVAGALDSAWRCVWEILAKDGTDEQKKEFERKYGGRKEFDDAETAALQYYRGVYANSLEKPSGNNGSFHYP